MKRLLPLCLLPLLAACEAPPQDGPAGRIANIFERSEAEAAEPPAPAPLPPQVLAALPAGVPPTVVQRGGDGCYILTIEVTTPPSGYPLRDALGNPVCDGSPMAAPAVAPAALPGVTAAVEPAPLPFPLPGSPARLDGSAPPLVSGSITPPAPLAPLNPG
ncbi:MAG TPA: hypothetical protein VM899_08320 [Rubellimicrobium sp.]|jgi:hypothetical protein|nr:hypothetical protein [Rubellimicrobium sp.]